MLRFETILDASASSPDQSETVFHVYTQYYEDLKVGIVKQFSLCILSCVRHGNSADSTMTPEYFSGPWTIRSKHYCAIAGQISRVQHI